jgi:transcription initiation factor TFIIIB Brf1 subunit/transcription initiation factor TFIIB
MSTVLEMGEGEEESHNKRAEKQLQRAITAVESNDALSAPVKTKCIEILQRIKQEQQRLYLPDEVADIVIRLVTQGGEPGSEDKRLKKAYQKIRDDLQSWGLIPEESLETLQLREFSEICIKLNIEPENIEKLLSHYRNAIENVLLGGKSLPYTIASVIVRHSKEAVGTPLSESQVLELCRMLKIKEKTLKRYTTIAKPIKPRSRETAPVEKSGKRKKLNIPVTDNN